MAGAVGSECLSCTRFIDLSSAKGVPSGVAVCRACWRKIPVVERVKISISIQDRLPGGALSEIAELVSQAVRQNLKDGTGQFGHEDP
jgi:hypothetical protein